MATTAEFTYSQVGEHDTKESLWVVIDEKVYDVSKFVDEHPGGEEVMLDVAGQDGTEAFEDVGHSDEAREILAQYIVGNLKRDPSDPKPAVKARTSASSGDEGSSGGIPGIVYAVLVAGLAAGGYYYLQLQQQQASV
ncbi:hypothetical protein H072_4055 [Dactylellina haptotyla CBS 200.50]|uniref:Cytochrome b5 heme-binding domain-containing protein n=1 Tax=Dactylellina haptotyla (strain CBS 200.50) TaxID=1284197 RepID=S8BRB6_DACHA|nr:hypothetical protein H072_4055 [Dactylellina haptotyla CBS 200.50]